MGKKTADKSPCRAKGDLGGGYENLENSKNDKNSTNALNSSENLQENTQNSTTQSLRASATKRGNPLHFVIASEECGNPQSKHIDCHNFAKAKSRNDDTSKLEQEIDKLVYSLYDLNENEIKLIEKA